MIYDFLNRNLPDNLNVTAHHHASEIHEPNNFHEYMWFANDDGEFPIAREEGEKNGTHFHTATALAVHFEEAHWRKKPNLDLYSCRVNHHHDCMPKDAPQPWEV